VCNHPNVIKLVETFESDEEISLVLELMNGGDLFDRIASKGTYSEGEARTAMYNIFSAVDYLHDKSIVHRDLKPENLLYAGKEDSALLKIADFGLSKYVTEFGGLETPCGTLAYTAPEVTSKTSYRKVVDIWSCGCILYFMLFGKPPFYSIIEEEIFDLVADGRYSIPSSPLVSDAAKELVGFLLEKDPAKRYTAKQSLLHPWITGQSLRPREIFTSPKAVSAPLSIINLRASLNSAIDAQRGPLTPPLCSPLDSAIWKKRAAKLRAGTTPLVLSEAPNDSSSSESENNEEIENNNFDIKDEMEI